MTAVAFAALVVATFGAFFAAQRLKRTPPVVQRVGVDPFFSPNGDGRFERARIGFALKRDDEVAVTVLDPSGEPVRDLVEGRALDAGRLLRTRWDGRDDQGRRLPDGLYRVRVALRDEGRSVRLPRTIRLDTTPPRPRVLSIGPFPTAPELLPTATGEPARVTFFAPGPRDKVEVEVVRTSPGRPRVLQQLPFRGGGRENGGRGVASWDGTRGGRRVAPGTFLVRVRARDQAGNVGTSAPQGPALARADELRGRAGITVRYIGLQPPPVPIRGGAPIVVGVDARGEPYRWSLRRVGAPHPVRTGRRTRGGPLRIQAPDGEAGLFLVEVRTARHAARVPVAVDGRTRRRVLVVLPYATWQGRNRVDDDGDGLPDTLLDGGPVRLGRVLAGDGLPFGMARSTAPLLAHLDRAELRYDLTTDAALATGVGPKLDGHRGVLLPGDAVWVPAALAPRLRRFALGGGTVASFGTGSLLRTVRLTPRRLSDPSPRAPADLFGARLGPVRRGPVDLTILEDSRVGLFAGGEGLFRGVEAFEPTRGWVEAEQVASAVAPGAVPVLVAARFGRGLVIRTGVPAFATRLGGDPDAVALVRRIWTLLAR